MNNPGSTSTVFLTNWLFTKTYFETSPSKKTLTRNRPSAQRQGHWRWGRTYPRQRAWHGYRTSVAAERLIVPMWQRCQRQTHRRWGARCQHQSVWRLDAQRQRQRGWRWAWLLSGRPRPPHPSLSSFLCSPPALGFLILSPPPLTQYPQIHLKSKGDSWGLSWESFGKVNSSENPNFPDIILCILHWFGSNRGLRIVCLGWIVSWIMWVGM